MTERPALFRPNTLRSLLAASLIASLCACATTTPDKSATEDEPGTAQSDATQLPSPSDYTPTPPPGGYTLAFDSNELAAGIRPQDDFWGYVNARWIDQTDIPADRSSYGTFHQLNDLTETQLRAILDNTVAQKGGVDADTDIIRNLNASFMNTGKIQEQGLSPLTELLSEIDQINNAEQLATAFGKLSALGVTTPIAFYADNNAEDAQQLILYLWQGGLGLPNRDYYLNNQEKLALAREQYRHHIQKMFALAGWPNGAAAADHVMAIEEKIANLHWSQVQNRDRETIYSNQYNPTEAAALLTGFPIQAWFAGMGQGLAVPEKFVLAQTSYFAGLNNLVNSADIDHWRLYLKFHLLSAFASFLPADIDAENFDFKGKKLRGQERQADRWKRAVRLLNRSVGELLGKIYVAEHFAPQSKAQINALVENLRAAFADSIKNLDWMSDTTKEQALIKLAAFLPKLGYPDEWRDFSGLSVHPDQLLQNVLNVRAFNHAHNLQKLNKPVDRREWTTNPQTVNAFYRPTHNSITFPAGILQHPMFDADNDPAMNYGAIGSVIGHEFSHGFDDQGRKFDGEGLLRNWWTDADAEQYRQRADVLVGQYNNFLPLADTAINGKLTLGENIGDLAGVTMALRAFELSGLADGPSINGLSPRQRFFIGYALAFRSKYREPLLREVLLRDPHSPGEYRVTGVLRNVPGFYAAFDVQPGDGMYLPPEERAKIW